MKPPTPAWVIYALIGVEEQKGKRKKEKKKKGADPNSATLDHLVASDDPHGSYGGLIRGDKMLVSNGRHLPPGGALHFI